VSSDDLAQCRQASLSGFLGELLPQLFEQYPLLRQKRGAPSDFFRMLHLHDRQCENAATIQQVAAKRRAILPAVRRKVDTVRDHVSSVCFVWAYNAGDLVTSFTSSDGTASYGYDPTNQLTSATYTTASGGHQPGNESYSFDKNGNRNMAGWTTGSDNLISSDGTFNYQHDADGNQTVRTRISTSFASDYNGATT
jgi:RHS repeat protein